MTHPPRPAPRGATGRIVTVLTVLLAASALTAIVLGVLVIARPPGQGPEGPALVAAATTAALAAALPVTRAAERRHGPGRR